MKKLILVIAFAFVMVLFISLNYLLWDRENKVNSSAYKDASIAALGRDINNLESTNSVLKDKVDRLESDAKLLGQKNNELQQEKSKTSAILSQKNDNINQLKQMVDIKPFETVITKWVELINTKQYEQAYQLQTAQLINQQNMTVEEFTNYFKTNIKSIKLNSVSMYIKGQPEENRGDITLKVSLEVNCETTGSKTIFAEGINEKLFTVIFLKERNAWIVGNIQ